MLGCWKTSNCSAGDKKTAVPGRGKSDKLTPVNPTGEEGGEAKRIKGRKKGRRERE